MAYSVKEIYLTLQGEGWHAGRAAVFCRFAGCNLWSGLERDRATATCHFCDTEFVGTDGPGGGTFATPDALADAVAARWPKSGNGAGRFVVCTGGEPLLQLDAPLIAALHDRGLQVAVETNGTLPAPQGLDWVCVSPKAGAALVLRSGDELKLIYPQAGARPEAFEDLKFRHFSLQPMDGAARAENTRKVLDYCLAHPRWRVSLQTHKYLGIP
ncbi:MAG: 7-carboxy-7-deazaguanine synthase [Rhodospirillales bacterium]|nr:7-carboxy-7-deazaguanine synthase [Rhodospirillales bacterium]